jgi:hypothetical protein
MFNRHLVRAVRNTAVLAALAAASSVASATPYFITYTGTIFDSTFPEVNNGESYTATLVFDNGGVSSASQTWNAGDLTCAIWTANNAQDVQFAHDLTAQGSLSVAGTVTTNGAGSLTSNFGRVNADPVDPGTYTFSGAAISDTVNWFMNEASPVFASGSFGPEWSDADLSAGAGVNMDIASWTNPAPFSGSCTASVPPPTPTPTATPVPTMTAYGLVLTALGLLFVAARRLRVSAKRK